MEGDCLRMRVTVVLGCTHLGLHAVGEEHKRGLTPCVVVVLVVGVRDRKRPLESWTTGGPSVIGQSLWGRMWLVKGSHGMRTKRTLFSARELAATAVCC